MPRARISQFGFRALIIFTSPRARAVAPREPCKRKEPCEGNRPPCEGNRIRMYAGPVSWVSNYNPWL